MTKVRQKSAQKPAPLTRQIMIHRGVFALLILLAGFILTRPQVLDQIQERFASEPTVDTHGGINNPDAELARLFTREVLYWEDDINRWAKQFNLNPNLVATIMQIESCGDPLALSPGVGAQGLFQVMPLHFSDGENQFDLDTNARAGLNHLSDCLGWDDF